MLSKQHLVNPGLRYQQGRRDPGEAPPPNVPAANPNVASAPARNSNSQDVWLNHVNTPAPDSGVALRPAYLQSSDHARYEAPPPPSRLNSRVAEDSSYYTDTGPPSRMNSVGPPSRLNSVGPPSRLNSRDPDQSFYSGDSTDNSLRAAPGAVRMPGMDGQQQDDSTTGMMELPAAVDPYHHVVAQAVDESAESDRELLQRVLNLESELKKSYQTMMASTHTRDDGSDPEAEVLRRRVQQLETQLESGRSQNSNNNDSAEFANANLDESVRTAASNRVIVATVEASVRVSKPPRDIEEGDSDDEDESKGMAKGVKCCIFLLLLVGGAGAAVYFFAIAPEAKKTGNANPVGTGEGNPTEVPIPPPPTLAPTETSLPICQPLTNLFQGNSSYVPSGSQSQTFTIDCNVDGDVSAIQIDRVTCKPSCAFWLEKSAYSDMCVDNAFDFKIPDEYFGNDKLEVGHLALDGSFTCTDAPKYVIPDPSEAPTMAPTAVASFNPTLSVLVPTEPPTQTPTPPPTPPPTKTPTPPPTKPPTPPPTKPPTSPPTPPPTPPPTEQAVDRLGEALNLFFPGESISENSAEYRAAEWAALNDSRNADINSVEFRERFTLANLYYATSGESWNRRSGWTGGSNHCNWESVSCSNGQVTELDLRENNMSGTMIRTWSNLALISRLRLSDNALFGSLPAEIGGMSTLGRLELSENSLDGEFPTQVGQLAQLTNLQIRNNSFRGTIPTHLGRLNRLRSFIAEFNQFTGQIPDELSGMTSLRNIYLGRNQLEGPIPASFGRFSQLTLLSISENRLSGAIPAELGRLTNLKRFSVAQNQFSSSIPDELGAWTAMTYLSVFDNQLTGTIPSSLSQWKNTDTIYFYETGITGSMSTFCSSTNAGTATFEFYAECGLQCSCCTHCCTNQNCNSV